MRSSDPSAAADSLSDLWMRLFAFGLPLVLAWAFMELCMAQVPNSYSMKREQLRTLGSGVDTVIVGSSNAYWGISSEALSGSAFNLANVSQTLYYDDRLLPNLKRVLVSVSYISLFMRFTRGEVESWRQYYYQQEWGIPPRLLEDRLDVRMWSRLALAMPPLPLGSLGDGLKALRSGIKTQTVTGMDKSGWWRESWQAGNLSPEAAAINLTRHHGLMHESNLAGNLASLEHLFTILNQRNVEVVLVTLPVWHTYADGMRADTWDRAVRNYERLAREQGGRYLCFLHTPQLLPEEFYDPDHLNTRGAIHFTAILKAALDETTLR
jgi:hypothetical protein